MIINAPTIAFPTAGGSFGPQHQANQQYQLMPAPMDIFSNSQRQQQLYENMGGFMGGADGLDEEGEEQDEGLNGDEADFMPEIIAVDAPNGDPIYYQRI